MKIDVKNIYSEHDEIFALIPWYINGSLDDNEARLTEAHSKMCLVCRAEIAAQKQIAERIADVDIEALEIKAGFDNLRHRITTDGQASPKSWTERVKRALSTCIPATNNLAASKIPLAFASLGLVIGVAVLLVASREATNNVDPFATGAEYRTLAATPKLNNVENEILLVFQQGVPIEKVNQTLQDLGLVRVAGPSNTGVLRVRTSDVHTPRTSTLDIVAALNRSPIVMLAEPAIAAE